MVVYIDVVFLLNALLDGLLLYFTGYLTGAERKFWRLLLAAALGGGYAVAAFTSFGAVLALLPVKVGFAALLVLVCFGWDGRFWRLVLVFLGLSCALAGVVLACGFFARTELSYRGAYLLPVKLPLLLASAAACFGALYWFSRGCLRHGTEGRIVTVSFELLGQRVELRALLDSGNTLCDGVTGKPILVVEGKCLEKVWPEDVGDCFTSEKLRQPEQAILEASARQCPLPLHLTPYRSVGTESGMLITCTAMNVKVNNYTEKRLSIALSPTSLSPRGEYEALWGGYQDGFRTRPKRSRKLGELPVGKENATSKKNQLCYSQCKVVYLYRFAPTFGGYRKG